LQAERSEAVGMLEAARISEDLATVNAASDVIVRCDRDAQILATYHNQLVQQQQRAQAQQPNKYGLTRQEMEIAEKSIQDRADVRLTRDQKHQMYANNKARYWQMRRDGTYSDGQGTQRAKF
jgi:hypothetical protein